jgi:hypothetical protein
MNSSLVQDLVGKECWHVSIGGVTLPTFTLGTGAAIPRSVMLANQKQPERFRSNRGSVELLVWCSWRYCEGGRVLEGSGQPSPEFPELVKLIGATILEVQYHAPFGDLDVRFSNGRALAVFCDTAPSTRDSIPNWELWTRTKILSAGPGTTLSIRDSVHPSVPRSTFNAPEASR